MKRKLSSRKLAEWITLLVSAGTILALIVYLIFDLTTPASPYIELVARPLPAEAKQVGDRYVLPVEIENRGQKTIGYASFRIVITAPHGTQTDSIELQYLAKNSRTRIYKYLERDPKHSRIDISPIYYKFE